MTLFRWFPLLTMLWLVGAIAGNPRNSILFTSGMAPAPVTAEEVCPKPVLSRLTRHKVATGETLESIAQRYNLIPATLMGFNPALRSGKVTVGAEIMVPPFNGIRVDVPAGASWQDLAAAYGARADVLFEANGCRRPAQVAFIPGVNWSPQNPAGRTAPASSNSQLTRYPLPATTTSFSSYGWGVHPTTGEVSFNSGIDLRATVGTSVFAVGNGTVAFAGQQGSYGNLVVINHQQGRQTRYAHLSSLQVKAGQTIRAGQVIGQVGTTGRPRLPEPHLHFEVRTNSALGWVAEDPEPYLKAINSR